MAKKTSKKKPERPLIATSWGHMVEIWQDCQRCALHKHRKKVVIGQGAVGKVMVIGQYPGKDEDESGVPFIGMGGGYTHAALQTAGIPWSDCFFDNCLACKCQKPLKAYLDPCRPRLEDCITIVGPQLIVGCGKIAANWLSGTQKSIDRLSCRIFHWHDIPVFCVTHPMESWRLKDAPDAQEKSLAKTQREFEALGFVAREMGLAGPAEE